MKQWICIAVCFVAISSLKAQNRLSDHNTIGWFTTTITPKISKKVSGHIEYQWRRNDVITHWQQSLFRLGVNYQVHPQVTVHMGYGWIKTFPYGTHNLASVPRSFPEHRIYEQLTVTSDVGRAKLLHRLRLEQRWVGRYTSLTEDDPNQFIYTNRLRYMPRLEVPLSSKWSAILFDEIFVGFGKNVGENVFDQNRVAALVGYRINKHSKLEAGFISQTVQLGREINDKNVFQYNNGLLINTVFNF